MTAIISRAELFGQGYDAHEIRRQVSSGKLVRVHRGYYALPTSTADEQWAIKREAHVRRTQAIVAAAESPVVVSHVSAAVLHGMPVPHRELGRVHLIQPSRSGGRQRQAARRTTAPLSPDDIVEINSMSVTSVHRTLVDLGRTLTPGWAVAALDEALRQARSTPSGLADALSRSGGLPGVGAARRAISAANPRAESVGESLSRVLLEQAGLGPDELQREFPHSTGVDRVDMWWSVGVIGEFDGRGKYLANQRPGMTMDEAVWQEKLREDRLRRLGFIIVRWVWDDLMRRPDEIIARVRSALQAARAGALR